MRKKNKTKSASSGVANRSGKNLRKNCLSLRAPRVYPLAFLYFIHVYTYNSVIGNNLMSYTHKSKGAGNAKRFTTNYKVSVLLKSELKKKTTTKS